MAETTSKTVYTNVDIWGPEVPARLDPDALYVAVDRQRRLRRMQWRTVAAEAGVSPSTLTRIGQGRRPDADGLVRLLAWLGTTDLAPFITQPATSVQPSV